MFKGQNDGDDRGGLPSVKESLPNEGKSDMSHGGGGGNYGGLMQVKEIRGYLKLLKINDRKVMKRNTKNAHNQQKKGLQFVVPSGVYII